MGSGEWRRGLGEEAGQASLGWSQVLRVAPPLLTAGDLKSVLGARMPPPLSTPAHSPTVGGHSPRPFAAPSEVRGRKPSSPPCPGPV